MLKNDTGNMKQNSIVSWIKEKTNNALKPETSSLIKGKGKLLTGFVFFIVALIAINLMYQTLSEEKGREMFSHLKPSIPSLPMKKSNSSNNVRESDSKTMLEMKGKNNEKLSESLVKAEWQPIDTLLASNDKRREKLFRKLNLNNGEYVIACVLVTCGDCDDIALALNKKANANLGHLGQIIAITTGSVEQANAWKSRLGLKFAVESVSDESFDDSGAVILPTLIKVKNFKAIGVSESASAID